MKDTLLVLFTAVWLLFGAGAAIATSVQQNAAETAASSQSTNVQSEDGDSRAPAAVAGNAGGGSSTVRVESDEDPASSAAGVFLATSDDTCMGSSGAGGQGMGFGFSIGSAWTDPNCIMVKNARELKAHGHDRAARARLCMDDDNAMAFELAGEPCPRELKSTQNAIAKLMELNPNYRVAHIPFIRTVGLRLGGEDAFPYRAKASVDLRPVTHFVNESGERETIQWASHRFLPSSLGGDLGSEIVAGTVPLAASAFVAPSPEPPESMDLMDGLE